MAAKKTTSPAADTKAAKAVEQELSADEILADMPELRAPARLRLRHKNGLRTIAFRAYSRMEELGIKTEGGAADVSTEKMLEMMDIAAEVDEWAESIAVDAEAYGDWAVEQQDNPQAFFAIMTRYMAAVGESTGSAS